MPRIYLIDDHTLIRQGLRALLTAAGHQVVGEAGEAGPALDAVAELQPDVVLLDLRLEHSSGLDLLVQLQRRAAGPRIVMLTMSHDAHAVAEAFRLGASGYLLKDASEQELLQAIATVMRGERHLGSGLAGRDAAAGTPKSGAVLLTQLSPRERQIVSMVVRGHSSASIARQLGLSPKTIDTYRSRLMSKLEVADVTALVRFAVRVGLVDAERS